MSNKTLGSFLSAIMLLQMPEIANAQDCQRLVDYFPTAVSFKDRTCRDGPQPPRYHSCLDQKANVEMMAKNILRCPGLSAAQRNYYTSAARQYDGSADAAVQRDMDARARAARQIPILTCPVGIPVNGMCVLP